MMSHLMLGGQNEYENSLDMSVNAQHLYSVRSSDPLLSLQMVCMAVSSAVTGLEQNLWRLSLGDPHHCMAFITSCYVCVVSPSHVCSNSKPKNTPNGAPVSQLNHLSMGSFPTEQRNYSSAMCLRVCVFPCLSQYSLLVGIQLHFFFFF